MCLALVLVVASVSSVNLALVDISLDLGTTSSQLTWIADHEIYGSGGVDRRMSQFYDVVVRFDCDAGPRDQSCHSK